MRWLGSKGIGDILSCDFVVCFFRIKGVASLADSLEFAEKRKSKAFRRTASPADATYFLCLATKSKQKPRLTPRGLNALGRPKWNSLAAFVLVFRYGRCLRLPFVAQKPSFLANLDEKASPASSLPHNSFHCPDPICMRVLARDGFCF